MRRTLVASIATAVVSCAPAPSGIVPGKMHEVKVKNIAPFEAHEECVKLVAGDRLEYSFEAQFPLAFNIHYHEGNAVILPLTRENVKADSGEFKVLLPQDYCLMWEAGPSPTPLDYRVRLIRPGR
ncbi:MAG TPA: hypothetical protein VNE58_04770 [Casimicrobiaceae bacterium]|nr:hypothetical protein [Casimicrobiaceae bacterium]